VKTYLISLSRAAFLDDIDVEIAHLLLCAVAATVALQREVGHHPVNGSEAAIQVIIESGVTLVQVAANFFALKRSGGSEDGNLLQHLDNVKLTPLVDIATLVCAEGGVLVQELLDLVFDHSDICAEVVRRKADLDKALLLHELFVRDVVDNILAKDRGGEGLK